MQKEKEHFSDFHYDSEEVQTSDGIGPMHEEKILGNTPKVPNASFSFSLLKVGFKNETKARQVVFLGCFPRFLLHA